MNPNIKQFLDNYTCEFEHGQWRGNFTKTRTLHKTRDQLTVDDWYDIKDAAMCGYWELPNNLQSSLNSKFNRLQEYQLDCGYGEFVTPESIVKIMQDTEFTRRYAEAQQLVWGVLVSCIEAIHFNQQQETDSDFVHDWFE